ncbi:uncharacterized protein Hap1MRO34_012362 isoform 2-T2 [Clarias gariepinus]|uniref:uncharacterized protein LOC128531337 isoform X2 n=1 Tax=Clarias gariepinus TaxID=13013 RepID=UPI00234DF2DA|nr:uncharacterized protein LOC128531337 isoform X2 [Clarias gariepinus]
MRLNVSLSFKVFSAFGIRMFHFLLLFLLSMTPVWILIFFLSKMYLAQPVDFDEAVSLVSADFGHTVALQCTLTEKSNNDLILWYKQKLGGIPQAIGITGLLITEIILPPFNKSTFQLHITEGNFFLSILHVTKDDEAMYFCGKSRVNIIEFSSGTFLSVKDRHPLDISVFQSGGLDSVPAGASVTLQCSVLSKSKAAELQVLWFRAAPPQSHPQIIYTHHNSSHQCESGSSTPTCVYNFSKNILSLSDTGTYYCAVVVCGKIIFGNGTRVQLASSKNPLLMILATALGVCAILLTAQTIIICRRTNSKYHSERQNIVRQKAPEQGHDVEMTSLNYAPLHLNKGKSKSGRRSGKPPQDIVYSEVSYIGAE